MFRDDVKRKTEQEEIIFLGNKAIYSKILSHSNLGNDYNQFHETQKQDSGHISEVIIVLR